VFERTVEWAIKQGIETATFHILTPYPGTALHRRLATQGRIITRNWDLYDTRHAVYRPAKMSAQQLEAGYWRAYHDFYRWGAILSSALTKEGWRERARHIAYAGGWKKCEPLWDLVIRAKRVCNFGGLLEAVLAGFGGSGGESPERPAPDPARARVARGALGDYGREPRTLNLPAPRLRVGGAGPG